LILPTWILSINSNFSEFLQAFGPLRNQFGNALVRMKSIIREKWFYGFLSKGEAENLLYGCATGTFLVRFSKTVGNFAISFMGNEKIYHISIKSHGDSKGFSIYESASNSDKYYNTLQDIIRAYHYALTVPVWNTLPYEPYFQGELTSTEGAEVLFSEPPGTYMVRFSSSYPGALACSYIDDGGSLKQLLFQKNQKNKWEISPNTSGLSFASVTELIAANSDILKTPLMNACSGVTTSIIDKWRQEIQDQQKIIDQIWKPFYTTN